MVAHPTNSPSTHNLPHQDYEGDHTRWNCGDSLGRKSNRVIRLLSINAGNFSVVEKKEGKVEDLCALIRSTQADITTLSEHGLNPKNLPSHEQWPERMYGQFENYRSKLSWNVNEKNTDQRLWGGTGTIIIGKTTQRILEMGDDPRGLGRWTWTKLRGFNGIIIRIISIYIPHNSSGQETVAGQHRRYYDDHKICGNIIDLLWKELDQELSKWYDDGEQLIVSGDFNQEVTEDDIKTYFEKYNMYEVPTTKHENTPETHIRNNQGKTIDGIWVSAGINPSASGYLKYDDWDHRPVWIEFDESQVFGRRETKTPPIRARRLKLDDKAATQIYLKTLNSLYCEHNFFDTFWNTANDIERYGVTPSLYKELDSLDRTRAKLMLKAEKKCRKFNAGEVPFSPICSNLSKAIQFLKTAIKKKQGKNVSSRKLERMAKKAKMPLLNWRSCSIEYLQYILKNKESENISAKAKSLEMRKSYIHKIAEEASRIEGHPLPRILKELRMREQSRSDARKIKKVISDPRAGGLNRIIAPNPSTGVREELLNEREIVGACIRENKKKYFQTYNTPSLMEPLLSEIGLKGDGPGVESILNGTFQCNNIDQYTEAYYKELKRPQNFTPIPEEEITPQINVDDLKHTKERTSSSPSGLHYGLWKANSTHNNINAVDAKFRDIAQKKGIIYTRWKKAIDVEILKEPGNYNVERMRTIVLVEGDHQLNSKRLGKIAMRHSDCKERKWIASEQYGCRKHHRAIEVVLNARLIDDLLRMFRRPAIICSNDAKSCFDRIIHSVFAICLRRIGCPKNAIASCIETLQNLEHHIRTAFGDSDQFYKGSSLRPPQGLVQGYGSAPTGWALVSSPIIEMMRSQGFGYTDWSCISNIVFHMVCFSFVDDTDIINTLEEGNYDIRQLIERTQKALNYWQGGLLATGGTLVPSKSYWYLIDFHCTPDGNWKYKTIEQSPGELKLNTPDEGEVTLKRYEVTEGKKALGVLNRHDGNESENVKWFKAKSSEWADKVRSGYISPRLAWKALESTITKSIEYPLAATCLSPEQCRDIMTPALTVGLRQSKIQKNFPRALVYGPLAGQGLGIKSINTLQLIEHVQVLTRHGDSDTLTGNLLRHEIEGISLHMGSATKIWELDPELWEPICPESWIKTTWIDAIYHHIFIEDPTMSLNSPAQGPTIMDIIIESQFSTKNYLKKINWCRMYIEAVYVSDLLTADGKNISEESWNCKRRKDLTSPYKWPRNKKPSSEAISIWKLALGQLLLQNRYMNDLKISTPVPQHMKNKKWNMRISDTGRLYYKDSTWKIYRPMNHRRRKTTFVEIGRGEPPDNSKYVSGYIDKFDRIRVTCEGDLYEYNPPQTTTDYIYPCTNINESIINNLRNTDELRRWSVTNCKLIGSDEAIISAILNHNIKIVTDGSHKDNYATAGVIFYADDDNILEIVTRTPGEINELNSYRAELSGHYSIITTLEVIEQMINNRNISATGDINIKCDNRGSLEIYNMEKVFEPYHSNFDLLSSLQKRIQRLPFNIKGEWVEGHQKEKNSNPLDIWALLNERADELAGKFREFLSRNEIATLPTPRLCHEGIRIYHRDTKLTNMDRSSMYNSIRWEECIDYWIRHERFQDFTINLVDWELVETSMKEIPSSKQRWVTKHASGNCGVSDTLFKWRMQTESTCPLCRTCDETTNHVFQCPEPIVTQHRNNQIMNLEEWLENKKTDPEITLIIIQSLKSWTTNNEPTCNSDREDIKQAFIDQNDIGWDNLLLGIGAKKWADCQQRYLESINKRSTGKRWLIEIQKKMLNTAWDFWNTRCNERWKPGNYFDKLAEEALDDAIFEELERGITHEFPQRSKHLFEIEPAEIMNYTVKSKKYWLQSVEAARRYSYIAPEDDEKSVYEPSRKFLRQWIETNRY